MITDEHKMATLGVVTLLLQRRKELDSLEESAAKYLEGIGAHVASESKYDSVLNEVREAVYNDGDDPEPAAANLLQAVGLSDA